MRKPGFVLNAVLLSVMLSCTAEYSKSKETADAISNRGIPMDIPETYAVEEEAEPVAQNTEEYDLIRESEFLSAIDNPLSTFSIDVDNASYSNIRRFLDYELPPPDAVRIEEMINYFSYEYGEPKDETPFAIVTECSSAPWDPEHQLMHIGLQGKKLDFVNLRPSNLVFLIDASGSMSDQNKLPLLKNALKILLQELSEEDRVAIVAYAGAAGLVLPSTPATEGDKILEALDNLEAGGSTAGGAGIELAYKVAEDNLLAEGNNRVILATDGDFNVGLSSSGGLVRMIEEKRQKNIYLTIVGLGMGNYKDGRMEQISNAGNGNYFYIDNIAEAEKVFKRDMRANLFTIARDVKIQVEFNPAKVKAYRLIGYENRKLANEDFADDTKDAGELGAGHTVTALYELIPVGSEEQVRNPGNLKYQKAEIEPSALEGEEMMTVKLRYKPLDSDKSLLLERVVETSELLALSNASDNFRFSAAVAGFGLLLRDSKFKGEATFEKVKGLAIGARGRDEFGYRAELIKLIEKAALLSTGMEAKK